MIQATLAQQILEHLTTAVLWFDDTLHLQVINSAAETLLEISAKQAYGLHVDTLWPDDNLCHEAVHQVLKKRCPIIERSVRMHLIGARSLTVDCSVTPVNDHRREIKFILVELIQVDQQLRFTREENILLQQQAARKVIRGLAHEIKNPLGGLRGAAQLLERELSSTELREYTQIIIGEADRLKNLLNRMLGPTVSLHKNQVNIHEILMRVRQLILSETGEGIHIECDFDPSIPNLFADADQLIQAILNVMRNAVQAMEGKGMILLCTRIHRQMTLGNKRYKLVVRLDITDNGPGIPIEILDQIFYPLITGRADGIGLGLSIAQSLVNQHGGLIECRSEPGETVFTLWLPVETEV